MVSVEVPRAQIAVNYLIKGDVATRPTFTALFRDDCGIGEGLEMTYALNPDIPDLLVYSAGSHNGAEADSTLSVHKKTGSEQGMEIYGRDIDPELVRQARRGRYPLPIYPNRPQQLEFAKNLLEEHGFVVETDPIVEKIVEIDEERQTRQFVTIDANNLRSGHTVNFEEGDIAAGRLSLPRPANLIFLNHVLYYLHPERAMRAARSVASCLATNGVLVVAVSEMEMPAAPAEADDPAVTPVYFDMWLPEIADVWSMDYGVERVPLKPGGNPNDPTDAIQLFVKR